MRFVDSVFSNEFTVTDSEGRATKWMLEIKPHTAVRLIVNDGENKYLKVLIHNKNLHSITTKIKLSFLDRNGEKKETVTRVEKFEPNSSLELCSHSWKSFGAWRSFLFGVGSSTIECELTIISSTISSDGPKGSHVSEAKCLSSLLEKSTKTLSEA